MLDLTIYFELTNRCQLNCIHCLKDNGTRSVSIALDLFKSIIDQTIEYGARKVGLVGGEPTLHPNFAEILEYCSSKGLGISIVTNGVNFPKVRRLLKDVKDNLDQVVFSLDGARQETHDQIRGRGSYRKVMDAVTICREENIPLGLQMVITSMNHLEVPDMCTLSADLGTTGLRFLELHPTPQAARLGLDVSPQKLVEIGAEVNKRAWESQFPITMVTASHEMSPWFPCPAQHQEEFTVDTWGNLALCTPLTSRAGGVPGTEVAGNLAEMSFYEAHRRLIQLIARLQDTKATAIKEGTMDRNDVWFPCWWCTKYFHKVDWMAEFPEHPWACQMDTGRLNVDEPAMTAGALSGGSR